MLSKLKLNLIRTAAPTIAILCLNFAEDISTPSKIAQYQPACQYRQWEDQSCYSALPYQVDFIMNVTEDLEIVQNFITHIFHSSRNLKPEVVDMVNRRYKDLI